MITKSERSRLNKQQPLKESYEKNHACLLLASSMNASQFAFMLLPSFNCLLFAFFVFFAAKSLHFLGLLCLFVVPLCIAFLQPSLASENLFRKVFKPALTENWTRNIFLALLSGTPTAREGIHAIHR